ncbi:MAG: GNAT family N-acetyltransferase [Mycoplasmataceae bacterium]|nr:GNAT family N-acetyltransferase [Mycoplasmataceae bacterium]
MSDVNFSSVYHVHDICDREQISIEKFLKACKKLGYDKIVFCEHCPWPIDSTFYDRKVSLKQLSTFKKEIIAKAAKMKIQVVVGAEIENVRLNNSFFRDVVNNPVFDFAILGQHFYFSNVVTENKTVPWTQFVSENEKVYNNFKKYKNKLTYKLMKVYARDLERAFKLDIYSWFAHPDIWTESYPYPDKKALWLTKKIIALAEKYQVPLGFNVARCSEHSWDGSCCPSKFFWLQVAKHPNIKVLLESDAHRIKELNPLMFRKAYQIACKWGLKHNIVVEVPLKYFHRTFYRTLNRSDLKQVAEFETEFKQYGYQPEQITKMFNDQNYRIIGAYNQEQLIGYAIISVSDAIDILKIFVVKKFRNRNVGTNLLTYITEEYPNKKILVEVNVKNLVAINFYLKNKFRKLNIRKQYYGEDDAQVMERGKGLTLRVFDK